MDELFLSVNSFQELDESSYMNTSETFKANGFSSRLQLKLITKDKIDFKDQKDFVWL